MKTVTLAAALAAFAAPAFAESHEMAFQGDATAGEEQFNRQCVACHVVQDPETDEVLAGRNGKVGPNLYGLAGRTMGSMDGFNYSDALAQMGENGAIWTEANFVGYVQDPTGWLREELDDRRARGKMAYQVRSEEDANNLYAFLATFAPDMEALQAEGDADSGS